MATAGKILNIDPPYGIAGGEIVIDCEGFDTSDPSQCAVLIGDSTAQIVASGPRRVLAIIPETRGGEVEVRLSSGGDLSEPASGYGWPKTGRRSSSGCKPCVRS